MTDVSIEIDEIVLHGVAADDVPAFRGSLEAELTRLASGGGAARERSSDLGTSVAAEVWSRVNPR